MTWDNFRDTADDSHHGNNMSASVLVHANGQQSTQPPSHPKIAIASFN